MKQICALRACGHNYCRGFLDVERSIRTLLTSHVELGVSRAPSVLPEPSFWWMSVFSVP